jgi:hypothetical protein
MNFQNRGTIITLVLVFGAIFLLLLAGLLGFILLQHRQSLQKVAWNEALNVAEAGINYSRWHINHAEDDFNFGGTKSYEDVGQYQLEITAPTGCSPGVKIKSTGWTSNFSQVIREVKVKYAKPSLAKYAFLTNSNVWFGPEEELKGPFHSNGGIRMDGQQNSLSTSAKETYICGPEHGCSSANCSDPCQWTTEGCQCPGIWCCPGGWCGEEGICGGRDLGLWEFPTPAIDFDKITQDLGTLKTEAQLTECLPADDCYFESSEAYGYHLDFLSNGTFDLYKVTKLKPEVWGWNMEEWVYESNSIESETLIDNYSLPPDCRPIFIEDNLWVSGDVKGRVTLAAARLPDIPGQEVKMIIWGDINYIDSGSVLGLIAQKDIIIPMGYPVDSKNRICSLENLEIKASLLAQKGRVFRYYYPNWWWKEPYKSCAILNYIETYGSIITNKVWTFTWVDSGGNVVSGYQETEMSYNPDLTYSPPPYFPVSGEYEILDWEEL